MIPPTIVINQVLGVIVIVLNNKSNKSSSYNNNNNKNINNNNNNNPNNKKNNDKDNDVGSNDIDNDSNHDNDNDDSNHSNEGADDGLGNRHEGACNSEWEILKKQGNAQAAKKSEINIRLNTSWGGIPTIYEENDIGKRERERGVRYMEVYHKKKEGKKEGTKETNLYDNFMTFVAD